jgi:mannitol-specific phosphotransferase system IIBC component
LFLPAFQPTNFFKRDGTRPSQRGADAYAKSACHRISSIGFQPLGGRLIQGSRGIAIGALVFLPLWLIGASINMYIGVKRVGYTPAQERLDSQPEGQL